jgi:hypothetical protein
MTYLTRSRTTETTKFEVLTVFRKLSNQNNDVCIDFDDAHNEWTSNKKKLPNGMYAYLCMKQMKNGKICKHVCCDKLGLYSGCKRHFSWEEKLMIP